MQFMDSEKVKEASSCGILDPTWVTKTNFIVNLDKKPEEYKDLTKKKFNNVLKKNTKRKKREVAPYIAHAISKFIKEGKTFPKTPYHFE
jgi:hypothetical protein